MHTIDVDEYCEQAMYDTDNQELVDRACYACGLCSPNYPVPAIPGRTGYQPHGAEGWELESYLYVCNRELLWTFWSGNVLVIETIFNDDLEIIDYGALQ